MRTSATPLSIRLARPVIGLDDGRLEGFLWVYTLCDYTEDGYDDLGNPARQLQCSARPDPIGDLLLCNCFEV